MDCSPPGSSVHGILQARILEWVSMPFSRRFSWPRDGTHVSCISRKIIYHLSQGSLQLLHSIGFSLTSLVKLGGLFSVWSSLKWECCSEFCLRLFSPFLIPHSTIFWKFCSHGLCDSNYLVHICRQAWLPAVHGVAESEKAEWLNWTIPDLEKYKLKQSLGLLLRFKGKTTFPLNSFQINED